MKMFLKLIVLFCFLVEVLSLEDFTCFLYKRTIELTNMVGSSFDNVDVLVEVNTSDLILSSKLENCSYLRFEEGTTLLNFFVENECGAEITRIWVHLNELPVAGTEVRMYYGCPDESKLPSNGEELYWNGKLYAFTNSTTCPHGWSITDIGVKDRFVHISDSPSGYEDGADNEGHTHFIDGNVKTTDPNDISKRSSTINAICGCSDPESLDISCPAEHVHNFSKNTSPPLGTTLPPFYTALMCESRSLDIFEGLIIPFNSSFVGEDLTFFSELDGRYLLASSTAGSYGGMASHNHNFSGAMIDMVVPGDTFEQFSETLPWSCANRHYHANFWLRTNPKENFPTSTSLPFYYMDGNVTNSTLMGYMVFFSDSLPPLGFESADISDRYVEGANDFEEYAHIFQSAVESIADFGMDGSGTTTTCCGDCGMDPLEGTRVPVEAHVHTEYDLTEFTETFDANDRDRYNVMAIRRMWDVANFVVGDEEELFWCDGLDPRDVEVCSQYGECTGPEDNNCTCFPGYYNTFCDYWDCGEFEKSDVHRTCQGHGECNSPDNCTCEDYVKYDGHLCGFTCDGIYSNMTDEVCFGHGSCDDYDNCTCADEVKYDGAYCGWKCFGKWFNDTLDVCYGRGNCSDYNYCNCHPEYFGVQCNISTCAGLFSNDSEVCSEHGVCSVFQTCDCSENYYGIDCNITTCDDVYSNESSVCGADTAVCWPFNHCECAEGYFGEFCNVTICEDFFSNQTDDVCHGHGTCWPLETCTCNSTDDQYHGPDCEFTWCFGLPSNLSDLVCSGKGHCWPVGECNCLEGYYNEQCNVTECGGYYSNETDYVCGGRGVCWGLENCSCDEPDLYFGNVCEFTSCFGEPSDGSSDSLCSNRGTCSSYNNCTCDEDHYFGTNCNLTTCQGILSDIVEEVCNFGRGECVAHDECECYSNIYDYYGLACIDYVPSVNTTYFVGWSYLIIQYVVNTTDLKTGDSCTDYIVNKNDLFDTLTPACEWVVDESLNRTQYMRVEMESTYPVITVAESHEIMLYVVSDGFTTMIDNITIEGRGAWPTEGNDDDEGEDEEDEDDGGDNTGAIAGGIAGGVSGVVLAGGISLCCLLIICSTCILICVCLLGVGGLVCCCGAGGGGTGLLAFRGRAKVDPSENVDKELKDINADGA